MWSRFFPGEWYMKPLSHFPLPKFVLRRLFSKRNLRRSGSSTNLCSRWSQWGQSQSDCSGIDLHQSRFGVRKEGKGGESDARHWSLARWCLAAVRFVVFFFLCDSIIRLIGRSVGRYERSIYPFLGITAPAQSHATVQPCLSILATGPPRWTNHEQGTDIPSYRSFGTNFQMRRFYSMYKYRHVMCYI